MKCQGSLETPATSLDGSKIICYTLQRFKGDIVILILEFWSGFEVY